MKAHLSVDAREVVIWKVARPVRGSDHNYKYRLALMVSGECVMRYDNEAGKGDHPHIGDREEPYSFSAVFRVL